MKADQARAKNIYLKACTYRRSACVEASTMKLVNGMGTKDLVEREAKVDGVRTLHQCKDLD